ncbi:hypothetical protein [Thermofilum sp.]|uniref:hypothetical protein n=1 Tax=Thermofilum sp. TaxID=1961369 RepID=UPI00315EF14D
MKRLLLILVMVALLHSATVYAQLPTPNVEKIKSDIISWAQIATLVFFIIVIAIAIAKAGYGGILLVLGIGPYAGTKGWGEIHEGIKGLFIVALIFLLIVWIPSLLFGWGLVSEPIYNVLSDTINKILNFKP